jgi:hypothetical protein
VANYRSPSNPLDCWGCDLLIEASQVLVYIDPTGSEGPATSPYHLGCFLDSAKLTLPSNRALLDFVEGHLGDLLAHCAGIAVRSYFRDSADS